MRGHIEAGTAVQAAMMKDKIRSACEQLHAHLIKYWCGFENWVAVPPFRAAAVPDMPHPLRSGDLVNSVRRVHRTDKEREAV